MSEALKRYEVVLRATYTGTVEVEATDEEEAAILAESQERYIDWTLLHAETDSVLLLGRIES